MALGDYNTPYFAADAKQVVGFCFFDLTSLSPVKLVCAWRTER